MSHRPKKIIFTAGAAGNILRLNQIRGIDLVSTAITNSGSSILAVVALEIERILSRILFDLQPGQLAMEDMDTISEILWDTWAIMHCRDLAKLITKASNTSATTLLVCE